LISAAAFKCNSGMIVIGGYHEKHFDITTKMLMEDVTPFRLEPGFIDNEGRFLNRQEAYRHAVQCGQVQYEVGEITLTAEQLW